MRKWFCVVAGSAVLMNVACGNEGLPEEELALVDTPAPTLRGLPAHDFAAVPKEVVEREYVRTPFGRAHPSCIYKLGEGEMMDEEGVVRQGERLVRSTPPCNYAPEITFPGTNRGTEVLPLTGWVEDAFIDPPLHNGFRMFNYTLSSFQVPGAPTTNHGQTIYIFPAFMPTDTASLLQPVLQWGADQYGGGAFWSIAPWAIIGTGDSRKVITTDKLPVVAREDITTQMQIVNRFIGHKIPGTFYTTEITMWDEDENIRTISAVTSAYAFTRLYLGAVEAWNVASCSDFPSTPVSFQWTSAYMPDTAWNNYWPVAAPIQAENKRPGTCGTSVNAFMQQVGYYQADFTY